MQSRQFRPWCLGWVGGNICGPQLPAGGDSPHVGLNLYSATQSSLLPWLLTAEEVLNCAPQMCVGTLQMSIRKHLKYWGGDKSEMTMCWHLINLRVDIHPSITKPKAKSFYADWLIICTVTCVQIIIPKHQKESTSESISFGDALESSRGNLGQHRKLFTSSIHSGAEFASIQSQTQGFLQSWIWFPRCLSRGTTWTRMVTDGKKGKNKKFHRWTFLPLQNRRTTLMFRLTDSHLRANSKP